MAKVDFLRGETVSITIDDAKTSTSVIMAALKKSGYSAKQTMAAPSDSK